MKDRLIELLRDFRIVYLPGSRQTGKTTLAIEIAGEVGMECGMLYYSGNTVLPFRYQGKTYHAIPISGLLGSNTTVPQSEGIDIKAY